MEYTEGIKKAKMQQCGHMNNTKLNELNIFINCRDVWENKHIRYFYEKENFMAEAIHTEA